MVALNRILFLVIFASYSLQLSAIHEVPNIIMTDIQGNQRNLYESLDEGKVVIVEVFATWCTTCWQNHKDYALQKIYNTYGPNGTQQLEIFYIEGDTETGIEELFGAGSFGDWTADVSYPIFSPTELDSDFLDSFAPYGVPTSSVICPQDKSVIADIYQNDLTEIIEIIQDCNTISGVKDVQILEPMESDLAICEPTDLIVKVLNTGTEPITSLDLDATFEDGTMFNSHSCDITIESGRYNTINLGQFEVPEFIQSKIINLNIVTPDDVSSNNSLEITFKQAEPVFKPLQLRIKTDRWVETDSTRWWIEDSSGEIAVPITYLTDDTEVTTDIAVNYNDCFTFVIADNYGDGFVLGEIELRTQEGIVLFDETNFRFRGEANFEFLGTAATSIDLLNSNDGYDLSFVSNLIESDLEAQISLPKIEKYNLSVIDLNGHIISNSESMATDTRIIKTVHVQDLNQGIYFLQLATEQGILTKKFIKQ